MAIFDLLREEHDRIQRTLEILLTERCKGEVFEQGRTRIEAHLEGEEEHVYPAIRAAGLRDQTLVAFEEHHVIRFMLRELVDMSDREEAWGAKLSVFAELVERHLRREEREAFPLAQEKIGRSAQRELEDEYRRFASSLAQAGGSLSAGEAPFFRWV